MNKNDIQDRLNAINTRLNEMVTACESEQRRLTEAEETEKSSLMEERGKLNQQLNEINSNNFKPMENEQKSNFSLLQAVRSVVNGGRFEGEYADEVRAMAAKSGLGYGGQIQMKACAPEMRALNGILTGGDNYASNSKNGGLEMVRTDVLPIIEAIYNYTVLERAGANFYNGMVGNAKLPVMSNINFGFKAENAAADVVTPTMAKVELTPQRLTGVIWLSKQLLNQTSEDLEARLRISIAKAIAQAFEKAVLADGHNSPHDGLMYNATTVALGSLTYDTILTLAESLYGANYTPTFIVDPMAARFLKQKAKLSYGNEAIMMSGRVDDEPTFITNSVKVSTATSGAIACADFSRLHVATWGDLLDITVDNVTKAADAKVGLILNYYCDWGWDAANGTAYACREVTNA